MGKAAPALDISEDKGASTEGEGIAREALDGEETGTLLTKSELLELGAEGIARTDAGRVESSDARGAVRA